MRYSRRRTTTGAILGLLALGAFVPTSTSATVPPESALAVGAAQVLTDDGSHLVGDGTGQEYVRYGTRWSTTTLTYGFVNHTGDLTVGAQEDAVARALATWSSVTPLQFQPVPDCGLAFNAVDCTTPDIRIAFGTGDHGGGGRDPDFDGPGGTAAHAYYPPPNGLSAAGDVHLDDGEQWTTTGGGTDLESIVLHELGHALGLAHATAGQCQTTAGPNRPIMCSVLIGIDRTLAPDDVAGAQAMYGPPVSACGGRAVTVDVGAGDLPTAGDDVIIGTGGPDVIAAGAGHDIVCGGAGDDEIDLGPGNDRGIGGGGADLLQGRSGADRLEGGGGSDHLVSGDQDDDVLGGPGGDDIDAGRGADTISAGPQSDDCDGRGGRDTATSCEARRNIP